MNKYKPRYETACIFIKALPLSLLMTSIVYGWTDAYEFLIIWTIFALVTSSILTAIDKERAREFYKRKAKERFEDFFN